MSTWSHLVSHSALHDAETGYKISGTEQNISEQSHSRLPPTFLTRTRISNEPQNHFKTHGHSRVFLLHLYGIYNWEVSFLILHWNCVLSWMVKHVQKPLAQHGQPVHPRVQDENDSCFKILIWGEKSLQFGALPKLPPSNWPSQNLDPQHCSGRRLADSVTTGLE